MSDRIAVALPGGRWLALTRETLCEALDAAREFGLEPNALTAVPTNAAPERRLNSEELQAVTGIHSTTWEARAKSGQVPCLRVGKTLRFKLSEVEAAVRAKTIL